MMTSRSTADIIASAIMLSIKKQTHIALFTTFTFCTCYLQDGVISVVKVVHFLRVLLIFVVKVGI